MQRSIAIIDHVGAKAGMDYYSGLLAQGLVNNGARCMVISNFVPQDARVEYRRYFAHHLGSTLRKGSNFFTAFFRAAWRCRAAHYPEAIVHLFSYELKDVYALRMLKAAGIRVTVIVHDVESFAGDTSQRRSRYMLQHLAQRIVVHNRFSLEQLLQVHGQDLLGKTKIIPHGNYHALPAAHPDKAAARRELGLGPDAFYLLFFGQIKEVKGLDLLLDAMTRLPERIRLVIAGKPWKSDFTRYEAQIQEAGTGPRITQMVRFIEDRERELLFRACDLLVIPYRQIFQSGVLLMGMSYRIPIVASDLPANRELLRDGENGWLFPDGDAEALATKILEAAGRPAQLARVAEQAWRDSDAQHNWDLIARSYLD